MITNIQASFTGYGGKAASVFSGYDSDARVLVVSVEADFRAARRDGCVVITNEPSIPRDRLFTEADIAAAIAAFYALKTGIASDGQSARIAFSDRAARTNPEQTIDRDGIDTNGMKYRVSESITCGQIAALATCLYAVQSDTVEQSVSMCETMRDMLLGHIRTI